MSQMILLMVVVGAACGTTPETEPPVVTPAKVPGPPDRSSPRISCDAEIEILCPDGYENGCGGGRTTSMACVKKGAIAAATCDSEIVLRCPPGEINSCSARPPYGDKHICVKQGP